MSTDRLLDLFLKFNKESRVEDISLEITERSSPYDDSLLDDDN